MKSKMRWKKIWITIAITVGLMTISGNASKAALQANSSTHIKNDSTVQKSGAYWMEEIRKMETVGNTMGLTEELNEDLSPKTTNNIDVHMMRTTEFGAMAILSASGFGNSNQLLDTETKVKSTTGNVTGVYITGDRMEFTAGVFTAGAVGKNARYYDVYGETIETAKIGDALGLATSANPGCTIEYGRTQGTTWHNGTCTWPGTGGYTMARGRTGIFTVRR